VWLQPQVDLLAYLGDHFTGFIHHVIAEPAQHLLAASGFGTQFRQQCVVDART